MFVENVLVIFLKYPQPGLVKTRLAKSIGKNAAAFLYRLFAENVIKRTEYKNYKTVLFYTPLNKRKEIMEWVGQDKEIYPQKGGNLGNRLANAFKSVFENGAKKVVAIGTDSPLLDKKNILKAFQVLKNNHCVIGPSFDGGYYLIGLSYFYKELFQNIAWGTDKVLPQTLSKLNNLNIKYSLLDKHFDVDNIEDLILLQQKL